MNPPKLRRALIVILAAEHNPGIISPQWLRENGVIQEPANQFVHSSDFSLFESDTYSLMMDRNRLQLTAKKLDAEALAGLQHTAATYLNLLPQIPYRALGINFVWLVEAAPGETVPQIGVRIADSDDLSEVLADHQVSYGAIVYGVKDPYRLRIMIEPEGSSTLVFSFNYHHDVEGLPAGSTSGYIEAFLDLYEHSQGITRIATTAGGHGNE